MTLQDGKHYDSEAALVALGRRSNVAGLSIDRAGVHIDEHGQLEVNGRFQTNVPHLYAAGDVIGGMALSSTALEEARTAMVNAFDVRYKCGVAQHLPIGVWTIPELSMVGETEQSLRHKKQPYIAGRWYYHHNPRGNFIGERWGLLKLLFSVPDERLVGVHVIGESACELIASGLVGMTMGATTSMFTDTCFNYPILSDMYKYAAYDAMGNLQRDDFFHG